MTSPTPLSTRHVSRRWLLGTVPVAAVVLAGCGSSDSTSSTSSSSSTPTTASSAVATGTAAAGSVAALAQAFHASLDADQKSAALLDYSLADAKRWSNLPQALLEGGFGGRGGGGGTSQSRIGLSIGTLTDAQLTAFTAMLQAATGTASGLGYDEVTQHLNADDYLQANGGGDDYGRAQFYVALLGSPQDTGTWELQFGGHHLALANTYVDGALVGATPAFRGIEPNEPFDLDGQTNQPMKVKHAAFQAMLAGLSADQLATAQLSDVYSDLVLGPGQDWAFPTTSEGVQVGTLRRPEGARPRGHRDLCQRPGRQRRSHHSGHLRGRARRHPPRLLGLLRPDRGERLRPHRRTVGVDRVLHAARHRAVGQPPALGLA